MALTLHVSSVAEAQAAIRDLEEYIRRERAQGSDLEDIAVLELTVHTSKILKAAGIGTVGQLVQFISDGSWRATDMGPKAFREVTEAIAKYHQHA